MDCPYCAGWGITLTCTGCYEPVGQCRASTIQCVGAGGGAFSEVGCSYCDETGRLTKKQQALQERFIDGKDRKRYR